MAQPNTSTTICSMAMDLLSQLEITTLLSPTTNPDRLAARWYDHVRRSCLRRHTWNFALKRTALSTLAQAPAFGYSAQCELPADYIRLVDIGETGDEQDYEVENFHLLVNLTGPINFRYVFNQEDVSKFDPLFIEVLVIELAIKMAPKYKGGLNGMAELLELADRAWEEAQGVDGQERPPKRVHRSPLKSARRGNVGRRNDIID